MKPWLSSPPDQKLREVSYSIWAMKYIGSSKYGINHDNHDNQASLDGRFFWMGEHHICILAMFGHRCHRSLESPPKVVRSFRSYEHLHGMFGGCFLIATCKNAKFGISRWGLKNLPNWGWGYSWGYNMIWPQPIVWSWLVVSQWLFEEGWIHSANHRECSTVDRYDLILPLLGPMKMN